MQESTKKNPAAGSVTAKTKSTQGGLSGFLSRVFDLQHGWFDSRNIIKNNFDLGVKQFRDGNTADAVFRFKITTWLNAKHAPSWYWLGRSLLSEGKQSEAIHALKQAAILKPGDEHIQYILAVAMAENASGKFLPTRVPPDLVKEHFESTASRYNATINTEGRTEHTQVAEVARQAAQQGRIDHVVLDLGMGTGLCGSQLRDIAASLTGVDISAAMLHQAMQLKDTSGNKTYDKLIQREALEFLDACDESFDIVLAAGLSHYAGDLDLLFAKSAKVLKPGGYMVMTAYASKDQPSRFDAKLEVFSFTKDYLESCAKKAGIMVTSLKESTLAPGQGGWVGVFTKP